MQYIGTLYAAGAGMAASVIGGGIYYAVADGFTTKLLGDLFGHTVKTLVYAAMLSIHLMGYFSTINPTVKEIHRQKGLSPEEREKDNEKSSVGPYVIIVVYHLILLALEYFIGMLGRSHLIKLATSLSIAACVISLKIPNWVPKKKEGRMKWLVLTALIFTVLSFVI